MTTRSLAKLQLGRVLRRLREGAGLSQEAFASRAGLHRTYISQIERGLANPSYSALDGILKVCGAGWEEFGRALDHERGS